MYYSPGDDELMRCEAFRESMANIFLLVVNIATRLSKGVGALVNSRADDIMALIDRAADLAPPGRAAAL